MKHSPTPTDLAIANLTAAFERYVAHRERLLDLALRPARCARESLSPLPSAPSGRTTITPSAA